mgnify:CR=1 FL=1
MGYMQGGGLIGSPLGFGRSESVASVHGRVAMRLALCGSVFRGAGTDSVACRGSCALVVLWRASSGEAAPSYQEKK